MSGAGRSTALHVLEDLGFFCVDNLPPSLAPRLLEMLGDGDGIGRVALGVDVRTGAFLEGAAQVFDVLEQGGHEVEVLFLDSSDEALVHRFSETRRPHPLAPGGDVVAAIKRERERLASLRARATHVIDTTDRSIHDTRRLLVDWVARGGGRPRMVTRVVSFGFKYGLPLDADLVFDLRYLPNPHFVPELKPLTGLDENVSRFVLEAPATKELHVRARAAAGAPVAALRARGQELPDHRGRLHRWQASLGRRRRGARDAPSCGRRGGGRAPRHETDRGVIHTVEQTFEIVNTLGMHARAATKLVQTAARFESTVEIEKDGQRADAKSVMGVLLLCGQQGARVTVRATGLDAEAAVEAIGALIRARFGEDE